MARVVAGAVRRGKRGERAARRRDWERARATMAAGRQRKATFQFRGPRESQRWTPDWPDCQRLRRRARGVRRRMAGMRRAVS
jgi:hypothetical protein